MTRAGQVGRPPLSERRSGPTCNKLHLTPPLEPCPSLELCARQRVRAKNVPDTFSDPFLDTLSGTPTQPASGRQEHKRAEARAPVGAQPGIHAGRLVAVISIPLR